MPSFSQEFYRGDQSRANYRGCSNRYPSKSVPPGKMIASLLHIGLKVRSKSSEFLKDCREQNFAFGLRCRFGLKRQCRLFLFRCHIINIYKYAYLCNFSHKCEGFCGFARFFLVKLRVLCKFQHKMCNFWFILEKFRACLSFICAIALPLLCRCSTIA